MKISIIVPVYNGEKYLKNTIQSLLTQPYKDIELILVNDGSTDSSAEICNEFRNDSRVNVIEKENQGISAARNDGIKIAKGEYISFIDQDDEIIPEIYLVLSRAIENHDIVIAGKKTQLIDSKGVVLEEKVYSFPEKLINNKEEILKLMFNSNRDTASFHLWNCLYRKSIISKYNLKFSENMKFGHEDTLFNLSYLSHCNDVYELSDVVYNYYRRSMTSTSLKNNENYIKDFNSYAEELCQSISNICTTDKHFAMLNTYLLRLGISLVAQYGNDYNDVVKIKEIANMNSGKTAISQDAVDNRIYYFALNAISKAISVGWYSIAYKVIKLLK